MSGPGTDGDRSAGSFAGKRLPQRTYIGTPSVEAYGELPRRIERLKAIEAASEQHERRLTARWHELAEEHAADPAAFARAWEQLAARWRFDEVNDLIDEHNEWFPLEARLPIDPRTKDYRGIFGRPYRKDPLDGSWILERFPARLDDALSS